MNGIENQIVATKCFQHSKGLNRKNYFPQAQTNTRRDHIFNNGHNHEPFWFSGQGGSGCGDMLGVPSTKGSRWRETLARPWSVRRNGFALMWQSEPKRRIMRSGRLQNYTKTLRIYVKTRNHAILFELLISPLWGTNTFCFTVGKNFHLQNFAPLLVAWGRPLCQLAHEMSHPTPRRPRSPVVKANTHPRNGPIFPHHRESHLCQNPPPPPPSPPRPVGPACLV